MWSPPPPTIEAATASHPTLDVVAYTLTLSNVFESLLNAHPDAVLHTLPSDSASPFPRLNPSLSQLNTPRSSDHLLPAMHQARLIKTPHEIELIRKANAISSRAHETIMRLLGKFAKEDILGGSEEGKLSMPGDWRIEREAEAEAVFVASCRREG